VLVEASILSRSSISGLSTKRLTSTLNDIILIRLLIYNGFKRVLQQQITRQLDFFLNSSLFEKRKIRNFIYNNLNL
jgi:hypothetical protein